MTEHLTDRRSFLAAGGAGIGLLGLPGRAYAAAAGFTHGVASGDPKQASVILWTRYRPANGGEARVRVEVAEDDRFRRIVARGEGVASPHADHCVKLRPAGLKPGRWYHYRFIAEGGDRSPPGRTRTLPAKGTDPFRIAVMSCANKEFGFFNGYAHVAAREDIDLVIHLGDYIYEWGTGEHSQAAKAMADRAALPPGETVTLADYRARYADYRADPDLAALHARLPMISIIDDHEVTNNSWRGGASNHDTGEGTWDARKGAAMQAYHEWLPMPDTPYDRYDIGDLGAIFRLETRLLARDEPLDLGDALKGAANPLAAAAAFRDGALADSRRTMLGAAQERWLGDGFAASVKAGQRWQVLAQQVVMGPMVLPSQAPGWFAAPPPAATVERLKLGVAAAKLGLPFSMDNWNGYPAARSRLLDSAIAAKANLITLSGDSHNAWAFDLASGNRAAGVEFAGQSVASLGFEARFTADPTRIAADLVATNPALRWCDTSHRGYMTLTLDRDSARSEWTMLDTVRRRSLAVAGTTTAQVAHGARRMEIA